MSKSQSNETKGVKTLLGEPKKAVIRLAIPMMLAMSVSTLYNLVDGLWVSGLGANALAAVGFVFPFFFMILAFATGLGVGGGAAISRRIGADDKKGADNVAVHTIIIMLVLAISFSIPFFVFAENIFSLMNGGIVAAMATSYAHVIALGSVIMFFSFVSNAILRSEGDAKRAMYAITLGAGLNIVLDPFFIYENITLGGITINALGLGVAGAAWASVLSMSISSTFLFNWLFLKKDTYVSFTFHDFHFDKLIVKDIFRVGLPASITQLSMSIMMLMMNFILVGVGGTNGVAVFSAGWRVVTTATMPLSGIATAVVTVIGAAYGAKDYKKLDTAYMYAIKIGAIIGSIIALATFILAPLITMAFTQAENSVRPEDLTNFLRIVCIFYPAVAFGMFSSSMFQGTGKGMYSLIVTVFRTIVLILPLAWIFSNILGLGLAGVWIGLVVANIIGSLIAFTWGKLYVRNLRKHGAKTDCL